MAARVCRGRRFSLAEFGCGVYGLVMEQFGQTIVQFVQANQVWGPPIVGLLAFCESLAVISLFVPATSILLGIGLLAAATNIDLVPVILAGGTGAALGDWVSYWFGRRYGNDVKNMRPFVHRRAMFERGEAFFGRWGAAGVFIGRFFGPLRAIVPLLAGTSHMAFWPFQTATWTSAWIWSALLLGGPSLGFSLWR